MLHAEDKPHSLVALEALINARLPLVELPDLLMEVDGWTGFSGHLEHADGAEPRAPELLVHCHTHPGAGLQLRLNADGTIGRNQKFYRFDTSIRYQNIGRLVRGTLKARLILGHWDDMLRVAGSLKLGWVTASLFIAKLQSFRRQNAAVAIYEPDCYSARSSA